MSVVWPVYLLAALGAAAGAFDGPARQALIPTLVPREHLPNALSLNQIMFQSASVLGPSIGGLLIASLGVGWAYLFNAVSFLFVLAALVMMRDVPVIDASERAAASFGAAREGLRFVFSSPIIRATMLLDFAATFFSSATALLPIFAQDVLHVGASGYGWLYAAPSVGSLLAGAVMIRTIDRIERRGVVLLWAITAYGLATVAFGVSRTFWLTFFCLAVTGAADAVSTVLRSIVRQLMTPDRLRGRVTSVNMIFFMGGPQLGRARSRPGGQLEGRAVLGDYRRHRHAHRRGRGRRAGACPAALPPNGRAAARGREQGTRGRGERVRGPRARGNGELVVPSIVSSSPDSHANSGFAQLPRFAFRALGMGCWGSTIEASSAAIARRPRARLLPASAWCEACRIGASGRGDTSSAPCCSTCT